MDTLTDFFLHTLNLSHPVVGFAVIGLGFIIFHTLLKITGFLTKLAVLGVIVIALAFYLR